MDSRLIFLLLLLAASLLAEDYYYRVLELTPDATDSDIKKAFRRLSVKYHPDKNPGDQAAAQKYLEVNKAYEILTDPEKKQLYDLYGEEGNFPRFLFKNPIFLRTFPWRRGHVGQPKDSERPKCQGGPSRDSGRVVQRSFQGIYD